MISFSKWFKKSYSFLLFLSILFLLPACGSNESTLTTQSENQEGIPVPSIISTALPPDGTLYAYLRIDDGPRQAMTINGGTASITLNGVSLGQHTIIMEFEFVLDTNPDQPLMLASSSQVMNVVAGDNPPLTFADYDTESFDTDGDGISNLAELSNNTNPFAGIVVSPVSGNTSEDGSIATFTVVLSSQPTADVVIGVSSSDTTEGTVDVATITFETNNWNTPQTVIITGIDDSIEDGDQAYSIDFTETVSGDNDFNGIQPASLNVTNVDNDSTGNQPPEVTLSINTSLPLAEAGGSANLTASLSTVSELPVTINLLYSGSATPGTDYSKSDSIVIPAGNTLAQTTITAIDDSENENNETIVVDIDTVINGFEVTAQQVTASIADDDMTVNFSQASQTLGESFGTVFVSINLDQPAAAALSIPYTVSGTASGGGVDHNLANGTFDIAAGNDTVVSNFTVVNDFIDEPTETIVITLGAAANITLGNIATQTINITDDDNAGFNISAISGDTTEAGGTASFTIRLSSQPTANVTIDVSSSNTAEGTVAPNSVTFSAANWNADQVITATGVDDTLADGDQTYSIVLALATSTDTNYNGLNPADVTVVNVDNDPLTEPMLSLVVGLKQLQFSWPAVSGATYYKLMENPDGVSGFTQLGGDIVGTSVNVDIVVHRLDWNNARYMLQACNANGCSSSNQVDIVADMLNAIGYVKTSNTQRVGLFGYSTALSSDGNTLAVGAPYEDSAATGINSNQTIDCGATASNCANSSGAVYIYTRNTSGVWSNTPVYVKASNTEGFDAFGYSVSLSGDGSTLAVGARSEDSAATGINGVQTEDCGATPQVNCAGTSGAVYIYHRDASGVWSNTPVYVKASNTGAGDMFGYSVSLSGDGNTLAVGANKEDSAATGINGDQGNDSNQSGAVYIYTRNASGVWSGVPVYVKASNTGVGDNFGESVSLSGDGNTLAVGAIVEDGSGAVYIYNRDASGVWGNTPVYVKASNPGTIDYFGYSISLSGDGSTLAVGANNEDSAATGINGVQIEDCSPTAPVNCATDSGAVYIYTRNAAGVWSNAPVYVKASNTGAEDHFGNSVSLSDDGNTLAVGASQEDNAATGINGDQIEDCNPTAPVNCASNSGAVYIYHRDASGVWSNSPVYVKASNTEAGDVFGASVNLSDDGNTLAVGANSEDSAATGINGNQTDDCGAATPSNCATDSGAVYLY